MSDSSASTKAKVHVSHHWIVIVPGDGFDTDPPGHVPNGLVAARRDAVVILTGIHSGVVEVEVRLRPFPPNAAASGWEEVEELEFVTTAGDMELWGFMETEPNGLPGLTPQGPGRYGLRVHTRGRAINPTAVPRIPFEHYLLDIWPIELGIDLAPSTEETGDQSSSPVDAIRAWARANPPQTERGRLSGSR
ncbi:hypothetical protein AB0B45_32010 [Nonomuraea sp. NPDC049152]|uniref:hypothetical protein n=1 Tax=Nonomuraea sp. NPDC049152 TaxID=3154350 RepID=UPI003405AEB0